MVYSLGCLCVHLDQVTVRRLQLIGGEVAPLMSRHSVIGQEPLSILQLWRNFRSLRADFISSFAAYQHFRSKGWIPKGGSGAKYGVDFRKITLNTITREWVS